MKNITRRLVTFGLGAAALATVAACGNGVGSNGAPTIDARADQTLSYLYNTYPSTRDIADKAAGVLVMPLITEAGVGLGAAYGRGVLRVGDVTVDYYSITQASAGFQFGAQQYAHTLFFMTEESLADFRRSSGYVAGADLEYVFQNEGDSFKADTNTITEPILAMVFGQAGVRIGATVEGAKYTRIIP
ncbi:MAG: YSC84-related protein [Paracoccaceae bacterium]|nr:YSC84-related protein [Paracoccaceae bacterium]MDG1737395.1 YSC84-related protein [Paracoccaceae bacterium]MDG2259115.1 YSC84-related protein [Paracoccaceae bacterium]